MHENTPPPATIRNVATLAGVSAAAVSRFVNGKQRFTPEVEARIAHAIEQTGYRSNPAARSMATGRSGTVAALVAGADNPHAAALVKGICRVALAERYDVLFVDTLLGASAQRELQRVMSLQVDGLVIAAPLFVGAGEMLARYGRPFIDLLRRTDPERPREANDTEAPPTAQETAGALLGRYLQRTGHRRIAWIDCAAEAGARERLKGLRRALNAASLMLSLHTATAATAEAGAALASSVLLGSERPDAVVACNDALAMGLISEARLLGVAVPDEVSVAGIGNTPFARYLTPALTSVDLHATEAGAQAMEWLLAAIRGEAQPSATRLPEPRLLVRESTRPRA